MIPKKALSRAIIPIAFVILASIGSLLIKFGKSDNTSDDVGTFTAQRSDMTIKVVESGNVKARNAVEIRSEVEGRTTIISVVPEGTIITEQDVKDGKILVELEASEIKEKLNQQEITFAGTEASYTEAKEAYDIQIKQNESDIQQGLLTVKFGLMDFQKYLGEELARKVLDSTDETGTFQIDIPSLIKDPNNLSGASLQQFRKLSSDIDLYREELERANNDLSWTEKLYEKEYVAGSDLEADKLRAQRSEIALEQARTALDLYMTYDFAKEAEKLFSDYLEAGRELDRIRAKARSKLAQAQATLKSSEAKYRLQKEQLDKIQRQFAACIIKAPAPGMVVYASQQRRFGSSRSDIEIGEEIRQREEIMSLPNSAEMAVEIKVHETSVDKLKPGQKALITVDALPDLQFTGEVLKIAPLPDPQSWMANPDLKVYSTDVSIDNGSEVIKPGMSAKVEIIVAQLQDVLSVPVQSVANRQGQKLCYVRTSAGVQSIPVVTGAFNETFVQITEGLTEGQKVMLNPPRLLSDEGQKQQSPRRLPETAMDRPTRPPDGADADRSAQFPASQRPTGTPQFQPGQRPQRDPQSSPGTRPAGPAQSPPNRQRQRGATEQ
jgi:HlyD family secretion protein